MTHPTSLLFWLKAADDDSYHAYRSRRRGTKPLCENAEAIGELSEMDTGGSRSKCCTQCFNALYGFPRIATK